MSIGLNIKKLRNELDLTQAKFAEQLGVSRFSILAYEKEETVPSAEFFILLIGIFDVNINWVLSGQGEMFNFNRTNKKADMFAKIFPKVPPEPDIIEMIELLEVPVLRFHIMKEFVIGKNELRKFIDDYFKSKEVSIEDAGKRRMPA